MKINNKNKGFTLLEILMVVAIIAILMGVLLPRIVGFRSGVNDTRRISDLRKVQGYLETYYMNNRNYPATPTNGWNDGSCGTDTLCEALKNANIGVTGLPDDPATDKDYEYAADSGQQHYILKAILDNINHTFLREENEVDGTSPITIGQITITGIDCGSATPGTDSMYCILF